MHVMSSKMNEDAVLALLDVAARIERRLDHHLSATRGVSFSEYRLLKALSEAGTQGAMRVALADAVGLTPSAVTRALRPMEKIGLVTTERHERDARRSMAALTPAGVALLADAERIVADVLDGLPVAGLPVEMLAGLQRELGAPRAARRHP